MTVSASTRNRSSRRPFASRALLTSSLSVLGLAAGLLTPVVVHAQEQPRAAFGSMLAMQHGQITLPDGTKSQWTGANRPVVGTDTDGRPLMSIQQTQQKALLDWEDFRLQAGEVLEFQQQRADWIAVNRVHGAQAAEIHGEIRAPGRVFVLNDNGVLIGEDAVINTRQLVTGTGVSDVNISGTTTTVVQSGPRSILEWRGDLSMGADEVLRIQQEKKDWIQMNRFVGGVAHLDGSIQADGHLYLIGPEGLSINGQVKAQQVLASQLNMTDEQFGIGLLAGMPTSNARRIPHLSNTWIPEQRLYFDQPLPVDANDPLRFNLTIGADGSIETGSLGKILLFGNNVTNRGVIHATDGQVVMGAGEHVWLDIGSAGRVESVVGPYAPYAIRSVDLTFNLFPIPGEPVDPADRYAHWLAYQADRARRIGFRVVNEGEVTSEHGDIDLRGFELRQMGAMAATSTALIRGNIDFAAFMFQQDYEYPGPYIGGNGSVVFGKDSITTILPDVLSKDAVALSAGMQSVGRIGVRARTVHMQDDSLIYAPSGNFRVLLDAGTHVANFGGNRGEGSNPDNEDGTRFMMEEGAVVDLSGWTDVALPMESNTVSGRLFISQLKDSPLQRNGPLYRQLVEIDRRFGTHVADWTAFDNLTQATLPQLLINGGVFELDVGNDFIMKSGAVIDVSGGAITYEAGFVSTTLLQTADGRIIDIRNADPDELYLGLANQFVVQDEKWGMSNAYYVPLMSSRQGRYEESYQHGGNAGRIEILAPDSVFQGTVRGEVVVGKYQRGAPPTGGVFSLNAHAGDTEGEYRNNRTLVTDIEQILGDEFTFESSLEDVSRDLFGEELAIGEYSTANTHFDNGALLSEDFFNRSSMGSYAIRQALYTAPEAPNGPANVIEAGVSLNLANGASFSLDLSDDLLFLGDFRSQGGDFEITSARAVVFSADTVIDTRGGWFSDYEFENEVPLVGVPRIHGGEVSISAGDAYGQEFGYPSDMGLVMPEGMTINTGGGAWVNREGHITLGRGGDITIDSAVTPGRPSILDANLSALGLGGNGALTLKLGWDDILISDDAAPEAEEGRRLRLFGSDFFENVGFSEINLSGRSFTIGEGTQIEASAATLTLLESFEGQSPYFAPTGTDLALLTSLNRVSPGLRPAALRDGMAISFASNADLNPEGTYGTPNLFAVEAGSRLSVEPGGSISLLSMGALDIQGDIFAPGGDIQLGATAIRVDADGEINAAGVARVLSEIRTPDGRILREGEVLAGGHISLLAGSIVLEEGAVLDVSGASAVFDVADKVGNTGAIVRTPRTIASAGGVISISGVNLDINDATYRAHAGGAGVRGGTFQLGFNAEMGALPEGPTPAEIAEAVGNLNWYGLTYHDGTPVEDIFTADLSQVAFENIFGVPFDFPPGYTLGSKEDLTALVQAFHDAALGGLSVLVVGDDLPPLSGGGTPGPDLPDMPQSLRDIMTSMTGAELPEPGPAATVATFSPGAIADGGFSTLDLSSGTVIQFMGQTRLGQFDEIDGYSFDRINLSAGAIISGDGADVRLTANTINLTTAGIDAKLATLLDIADIEPVNPGTQITLDAGSNLIVTSGEFFGFDTVSLLSRGDLSGFGLVRTPGDLRLQGDQIYATTRHLDQGLRPVDGLAVLEFASDRSIEVLAPADGVKTPAPYEAANTLTLRAPRITQGGVLRSPLGTINLIAVNDGTEGSGVLTLLPGSLTSASADGRVIPWGYTANGDTFLGPNGQELQTLPTKTVNLTGDVLDLQGDAVIDVSGGGDIFAYEFVAGVGGSHDWLTGYRDEDFNWVDDASEVFAVVPSFDVDPSKPNAGPQVYLSGGSGLAAGYYTLLPARYALLPGAFRVTARHGEGDFTNMPLGTSAQLNDGSTIQSGYRLEAGTSFRDQRSTGFMVMSGATLRTRSQYVETLANTFFQSEAYLRRALRTNLPLGVTPRTPLDGGSVTLSAIKNINLDATLLSAGGEDGRGGFADINAPRIAIVAAGDMDSTDYGSDYLLLDAEQLSRFGAESLLIGGVRRQGASGLEVDVSAETVVVDNAGSVLYGPEILLAATHDVRIEDGAVIEVRGQIGGSSGDLTLTPAVDRVVDPGFDPIYDYDDILVHESLDHGALFRASSDGLVGILRDPAALERMNALLEDPAALAAVNTQREALGLPPLALNGRLTVADGATIRGARSVVLDATSNTVLGAGATLETGQLSASASRISFGAVQPGVDGLVFAGGSLGALGRVEDLVLKSYGSIDFHGPVSITGTGALALDTRQFRSIGGGEVSITGDRLQLTNTSGVTSGAATGAGRLTVSGREVTLGTGMVALDGFGGVAIEGRERVIGKGVGGVRAPGDLTIRAGALTAESGASLTLDAAGAVTLASLAAPNLARFETLGATIDITGSSIRQGGVLDLAAGNVNLRARQGDVVLEAGSRIDVTGDVSTIFDRSTPANAGSVGLTSDRGDVIVSTGSTIDLSGAPEGGAAGTLRVSVPLGSVNLLGDVLASAAQGERGGAFELDALALSDFSGLGSLLNQAGFDYSRRFKIAQGDVVVSGDTRVQNFSLAANGGSITVTGAVQTTGRNGGSIRLSAAENLTLASTGQLIATGSNGGSGGSVILETAGANGGAVDVLAGSLIDVSGQGAGGRTVRIRAPQIGADMAIDRLDGRIVGARSVLAEAYRGYDDVETIDQGVIDQVSGDADAFMTGAGAIRTRLGGLVTVVPGVELRSDGDMTLVTDWDLSGMRYDGGAGVLTLRASGDLKLDANLSDGFSDASRDGALLDGDSWSISLTAGADLDSADSTGVLATGLLAPDKGSLIIGGVADELDYYVRSGSTDRALYLRDPETGAIIGGELTYDDALGAYIDPLTGQPIARDPETGEFVEAAYYGYQLLPYVQGGRFGPSGIPDNPAGVQIDTSDGYFVRTGTGSITAAAGRDIVFQEKSSALYTAGVQSAGIADFDAPTQLDPNGFEPIVAYYPENGGDISLRAQNDIVGGNSDQFPNAWLWSFGKSEGADNTFSPGVTGRAYEQTTWFVAFKNFKAGVGALGGGNIDISAGGDIANLSASIPTTGRVSGNRFEGDVAGRINTLGGGSLVVDAGGDILSGLYYVGDGQGDLTAGGAFRSGADVWGMFGANQGFGRSDSRQPIHTLLFTSSGQFRLRSGGDLNIEAVLDPMSGIAGFDNVTPAGTIWNFQVNARPGFGYFQTYEADAAVDLFSAGGDIKIWNNSIVVGARQILGAFNDEDRAPLLLGVTDYGPVWGAGNDYGAMHATAQHYLWPSNLSAVAAAGDVIVHGGFTMFPSATGNLELLASDNVYLDLVLDFADVNNTFRDPADYNFLTGSSTLLMSQSDPTLVPNPLDPTTVGESIMQTAATDPRIYSTAGYGSSYGMIEFSEINPPDLHKGDFDPVRIYAGEGDIFMNRNGRGVTGSVSLPKPAWFFAGGDIYFPNFVTQHNQGSDLSVYRAGGSIYFSPTSTIQTFGPGRLEVEAGRDIWIPSQGLGVQTGDIRVYDHQYDTVGHVLDPEAEGADIGISVGYNQRPSYESFEDAYLNPEKTADQADYLLDDLGDGRNLSVYLIDQVYDRAGGPDQAFPTETREGLVNYVRRQQGLEPLKDRKDQLAWLDQAWTAWQALNTDQKSSFYREVLFTELRSAGREATDPNSERYQSANRGYDAIRSLYPGAEKAADQALAEGESRWNGDFETYLSVVRSNGGGDIEFVAPGGSFRLANSLAGPSDPLRAGVVTVEGGEINIFTHDSVTVNESRILTAKGGNIMIWSSYGDIAAGRGARTSITPPNFIYKLAADGVLTREPGGLPSGAGIGTLATVEGTPPADVDLVAPNGIVDAGDGGIRVSGNFNVFAVQILGTDNIEVGGVATGLPQPPAQPPTSLDVDDAAAKSADVSEAIADAVQQVRDNTGVQTPSIIEVRVVGYGEDCRDRDGGGECAPPASSPRRRAEVKPTQPVQTAAVIDRPSSARVAATHRFNMPPQSLDDALRELGRVSGANLVYDSRTLPTARVVSLRGDMTVEQALTRLLAEDQVVWERTDPDTIVLRRKAPAQAR